MNVSQRVSSPSIKVGFSLLLLIALPMETLAESAAKAIAETKNGSALLADMAAKYASLESYLDYGVVLTHDPAKSSPDEIKFSTIFKRPTFLRFEWERHHPYEPLRHKRQRSVVWSNARGAFSVFLGVLEERPLSHGIAGATGVSRGSAHHVPRLLLPQQMSGFSLAELVDVSIVGEETFEGVRCYMVKAAHPRAGEYQLWIGKADLMLRRLYRPHPTGRDSEEFRRDIRINGDIPADVFEVDPAKFPKEP